MKTLYLMRHAKSSWKDASLSDRDRPLKPRGRRDAAEMGRRLCQRGFQPDRVLCSPALRARQTASILLEAAAAQQAVTMIDECLYFQGTEGWIEAIRSCADCADALLVVGHNPDFSALVARLARTPALDLPTAAIAGFACSDDGFLFPRGSLHLIDLDWPRKG